MADLARCNQKVYGGSDSCPNPPAFRFTWPGSDEAAICAEHSQALCGVASALGMFVQLTPIEPPAPPTVTVVGEGRRASGEALLARAFEATTILAELVAEVTRADRVEVELNAIIERLQKANDELRLRLERRDA